MTCPVCKKPLDVPTRATHNVAAYRSPVVTKTNCCGFAVKLTPILYVKAEVAYNCKEDDWGYKCLTRVKSEHIVEKLEKTEQKGENYE